MQVGSWLDKLSVYRKVWLLCLLPTIIGLPWLSYQASYWYGQHQAAQIRLAYIEQERKIEQSASDGLQRWQSNVSLWLRLATLARSQGRAMDLWEPHSVRVNDKRFSRQEADQFLGSLFTSDDAFVLTDTFTIKPVDRQGTLLVARPSEDEPKALFITLSGTYYSRRQP